MSIYQNIPYTYRISWTKTNMHYYGVRFAKNCHPSDLFVTYFTSSDYVAAYIKEHGMPDIIEVRKIFTGDDRVNQAIFHESRVLKRIKVIKRQDYLNKHDGKAVNLADPDVYNALIAGIKRGNERPSTRINRKECAIKSWQNPEIRKNRIDANNKPEVKSKRKASMNLSYANPDAHTRRSAASNEINSRPEILKANQERFRGKTFEERFGADRSKEIKELLSEEMARKWKTGKIKARSGLEHPTIDQTVYQWQNVKSGEIVSMTRIEMSEKYKLDSGKSYRLIQQRGKKNNRGRFYASRGWMLLP